MHGYFIFEENQAGEVSFFQSILGFELTFKDGYFTFPLLAEAPGYSLSGGKYLGADVTKTFQGKPWEIMRENGLVYDFSVSQVIPKTQVKDLLSLKTAGKYFISKGLIMPGSVRDDGSRVTDYAARYHRDLGQFRYSWVNL